MQALLHFAVEPANIVFTILLIAVLLYWLSVILGAWTWAPSALISVSMGT